MAGQEQRFAPGDFVRVTGQGLALWRVRKESTSSRGARSVEVMGMTGRDTGRFRAFRPDIVRKARHRKGESWE